MLFRSDSVPRQSIRSLFRALGSPPRTGRGQARRGKRRGQHYLQEKARKEAAERTEHIYRVIPQIREIDDRLTEVRKKLVHNMLNGKDGGSNKINEEKERLELERAGVLTDGNFDSDYTEVKYLCDKCRDTGITDMNEVCTCRLERLWEAELWLKQRANEESAL